MLSHLRSFHRSGRSLVQGDPRICVAILDSDVDIAHPSLQNASLKKILIPGFTPSSNKNHGTYVASIIFSNGAEDITGIAPKCRGIYIPVYSDTDAGLMCDQDRLADGIMLAADAGAHIINISGGVITPDNSSSLKLSNAVKHCADNHIQIVAAVGNEGCDCLHVPASLPGVLAVGGLDDAGEPYLFNNYGHIYRQQGLLVSLEGIKGAVPGLGSMHKAASSYAAPVVAGILALLGSVQMEASQKMDPAYLKELLLQTADQCPKSTPDECKRFLAGILNADEAHKRLAKELQAIMPSDNTKQERAVDTPVPVTEASMDLFRVAPSSLKEEAITPASFKEPGLIFTLGNFGYTFGSASVKRSVEASLQVNADDPLAFLEALLDQQKTGSIHPFFNRMYDAESVLWTFNIDGMPVYAVRPDDAFAKEVYAHIVKLMLYGIAHGVNANMIRCTLAGTINGKVKLMNGTEVPVVSPALRGLWCMEAGEVINAATNAAGKKMITPELVNKMEQAWFFLRNTGRTSQQRAMNYAVTNAVLVQQIFSNNDLVHLSLKSVQAQKSIFALPGSDCWDVTLTFFNPMKQMEEANTVYVFTVDVGSVVPFLTMPVRSWKT